MDEITPEQLLKELEHLKDKIELPELYLANYFTELRSKVDEECLTKQIQYENDEEKKLKLNKIWKELIDRIDSFEKQLIENQINFDQQTLERHDSIKTKLSNNELEIDLETIKKEINDIETNYLAELFQNKTIDFALQCVDKIEKNKNSKDNLINGKIIVLNDVFIKDLSDKLKR